MFDELVEKARKGDKLALEEIIRRLQPLLVASIRRYYNKAGEYEDLMQDGNLKIIQSIYDFDRTRGVHFLGFIKMNIKHLYLDKHKQKFHGSLNEKLEDGQGEIIDLLAADEVDFLEGLIKNEDLVELKKYLDILTPRQRQVVHRFYWEEMSIGEIAEDLGVAYRTVVNTKTTALKKMRGAVAYSILPFPSKLP